MISRRYRSATPSSTFSQSALDYQAVEREKWSGFFVPGMIFMYQLKPEELDGYNYAKKSKLEVPKGPPKPVRRRAVVVKTGPKSSVCLYIKTYENQGTTRKDIRSKQSRHAVVYTGAAPHTLPGETNLRAPIDADPISHETTIPKEARLCYESPFEFDHTRPVFPIAQVTAEGLQTLLHDFEEINAAPPRNAPPTRKRTWDRMQEQLDQQTTSNRRHGSRPPLIRKPTFPPIAEHGRRPSQSTPFPGGGDALRKEVQFFDRQGLPGHVCGALLDTGAELNFIDHNIARQLSLATLRYTGPGIRMGNGDVVPANESVKVRWRFLNGTKTETDAFIVFPGLPHDVVFGSKVIVKRRYLIPNHDLHILGLPNMSKEDRQKKERDEKQKSEQNRRQEAAEDEELERQIAEKRALVLKQTSMYKR